MNTFEKAVEFVLRFEGDFLDDSRDSGGATKFGISSRSYPDLDIKNLTRMQAIEIYRADYWNRLKANECPAQIAIVLFDAAVNQGLISAIRMLQKSLGVTVDGIMGPLTIAAALRADLRKVIPEFIARRGYQYALHPEVARFGLGWFRRLAACHQATMEPL